ncbi:NUDIX hydrolase [Brevundimonas variabilis]|uniref:GDP-mannose pyrophosphatase n=1 Tax=Brevundimonas variabilis TaxID=74312 RepID=A0A7W9CI72_9CAUL|nr:8-oxo-dGTP pyrophosphatase MutT (NUDIX family) [Brevundimonas variabilis]
MTKTEDDPVPEAIWAKGLAPVPAWQDQERQVVYDNAWLSVTEHSAIAPTGLASTYAVLRPKNLAVGVLPLHSDGTVTLVGQSRFALMNYSWEMPEGGAPFGEDPLDGAKRELAEEAGLAAGTWREVLRMEMSNSVTDEKAIGWLAWDLSPVPIAPDPTEVIVTVRVPFMTLMAEIDRGAVRDAFTVATALRAYHMARESLIPGWLVHAMLTRV